MKNIEELRNAKKDEAGNYIEEFNNLDIRNDENIQISEDTKEDEDIIENLQENIINDNLGNLRKITRL